MSILCFHMTVIYTLQLWKLFSPFVLVHTEFFPFFVEENPPCVVQGTGLCCNCIQMNYSMCSLLHRDKVNGTGNSMTTSVSESLRHIVCTLFAVVCNAADY
jgi:hypothetical protein